MIILMNLVEMKRWLERNSKVMNCTSINITVIINHGVAATEATELSCSAKPNTAICSSVEKALVVVPLAAWSVAGISFLLVLPCCFGHRTSRVGAMVLLPTFLDGLAKTISIRKARSCPYDVGREAANTMAKEATRNESILSSTAAVKTSKSSRIASACSKRGRKGINQDCFVLWEDFGCQEDMTFCGVFDGHGPWGHVVAKRVRELLPSLLLCKWQEAISLGFQDWNFEMEFDVNLQQFDIWKQSFLKTYAAADQELKLHRSIDTFRSGTTALTVVKQGENLLIANIGDSRAVLATTSDDGSLVPLQLTIDFKPNLPQEAERIKQSKGRVFCLPDELGAYRVWMPNDETLGLAVSRAFGDYCLKDFGLISVPYVTRRKITSHDQFVILATDGVWDVISNDEAVQIVLSAPDRESSAKKLVECAARAWKLKRRGIARDDISAICLYLRAAETDQSDPPLKGSDNRSRCENFEAPPRCE